jgi:O-antigen/teichoic acid export membrane protein
MELRRRLARGAGIATAGYFQSRAITFATFVVLAGLLEPRDVGQFAAGTVLVGAALVFSEGGMLSALIQWRDDIDDAASTAFVASIATGFGLIAFGVATAPLVGLFFGSYTVGMIAAATSGWLLLRALQVTPEALLQRRLSFVRRVVIDPIGAIAFGVAAITSAAAGLGPWALVIGTYAQLGVQLVAAWIFVGWWPKIGRASWTIWRRLVGYARHVVASEIVRRVSGILDTIILGRVAGSGALGQYAYGQRLASTPTDAWVSIAAYVLLPGFALIADDLARLRRAFEDSLAAMAVIAWPVSLLLVPLGEQFAVLAFGMRWLEAGVACQALAFAGIGRTVISVCSEVFKASGHPRILTRVHTFTLIVSLVVLPALAWGGVIGIGIAVSLVALLSGAFALRQAARIVEAGTWEIARRLGGIGAAAGVALALTMALDLFVFGTPTSRLSTLVPIIVESCAMGLSFLVALRLFASRDFASAVEIATHLKRRRAA